MSFKLRFRNGECISQQLAVDLGISEGDCVDPIIFDFCREAAFSSTDVGEFASWYLRSEALRKFDDGDPSSDARKTSEAFAKFKQAEEACGVANQWLVGWEMYTRFSLDVWRRARAICHSILGTRVPWDELPHGCSFGPGASLGLPRRKASHANKWEFSSHITDAALPYYEAFRRWSNIDLPVELSIVDGNRVTTVPKSWKTHRTIAIEPDWNAFLQRGVGVAIRRRLRKIGLLKPDAQKTHQELAQLGSATGFLATLDLSMASDSVSLALCEALLPTEWFKWIVDLRSPRGYMTGGEVVDYAKVSSMGNGFTFELETLLFYCLVSACFDKGDRAYISVYGDDIICPARKAERVMEILAEAGFSLNRDKSFWKGPFRESCGGHYWRGTDVTPFYLDGHPERFGDAINLHNKMLVWNERFEAITDLSFERTIRKVYGRVPRSLRGPRGMDGCLWAPWDRCTPEWSKRYQHYRVGTVRTVRWEKYVGGVWGAVLQKLWVEEPEAEISWSDKGASFEVFSNSIAYRDQWD